MTSRRGPTARTRCLACHEMVTVNLDGRIRVHPTLAARFERHRREWSRFPCAGSGVKVVGSRGPCADCGEDTVTEDYMVHNYLWAAYGVTPGLLCIPCLEDRMGRELWSGDFTHWPINLANGDMVHSDRLLDRLRREAPK